MESLGSSSKKSNLNNVKLPLIKSGGSRRSKKSSKCAVCSGIDILCVDDNLMNLEILTLMLSNNFKLKCAVAMNGQIAVNVIEEDLKKTCCRKFIRMVFMDFNMPVMDGSTSTLNIINLKKQQNEQVFREAAGFFSDREQINT